MEMWADASIQNTDIEFLQPSMSNIILNIY